MTNEEARNVIECMITNIVGEFADREMPKGAKHTYDALEKAEEALVKQIPKKIEDVITSDNEFIGKRCVCGFLLGVARNYCSNCGQSIDWSDEDDE